VNASGPWFEDIIPEPLRRLIIPVPQKWCAALNIEFNFERERDVAVGMASRSGRMFFLVPRGRSGAKYNCVAGTWYFPIKANERGEGYQQQTELFLTELRETFADDRMNAQNIASIDQGILPMARETASGPEPLGRHLITEVDGIVNIVSTKYTTFRLVGAEALQAAKRTLKRSPFC
jgi:glycerol-3-phosphate dehydrogenase